MPGLLGTEVWLCFFLLGTCACFASISAHLCKVDTSLVRDTKFSILREWPTHKSYRIVWWSAETKQPGCRTLAPRIPGELRTATYRHRSRRSWPKRGRPRRRRKSQKWCGFKSKSPGDGESGRKQLLLAALLAGKPGALLQGTFPSRPSPSLESNAWPFWIASATGSPRPRSDPEDDAATRPAARERAERAGASAFSGASQLVQVTRCTWVVKTVTCGMSAYLGRCYALCYSRLPCRSS